jgi:hypothetical protein
MDENKELKKKGIKITKLDEPIYKCPSCGNTKRFFEEGLAKVKNEIEVNNESNEVTEVNCFEIGDFIGDTKVICGECGAEIG